MPRSIDEIREKILNDEYRYSEHAVKRMIQRSIQRHEVEEAVISGDIIEDYPTDKYSPSCLIYGKTVTGRDLHIHISFPPKVVVVTVYEPDPDEWIDCRIRR